MTIHMAYPDRRVDFAWIPFTNREESKKPKKAERLVVGTLATLRQAFGPQRSLQEISDTQFERYTNKHLLDIRVPTNCT